MTTLSRAVNPAQRALLASWVRHSPRAMLCDATFPEIDERVLNMVLGEVRATHERYRGTPSVLIAPVPELLRGNGNGNRDGDGPVRPASDALDGRLSLWERAWLAAHADPSAQAYDAFINMRVELVDFQLPVLDHAGVFVLTSASLDVARERARALAASTDRPTLMWMEGDNDRGPWIHWLAGTPGATLPTIGATSADGDDVLAALRGEWAQVNELTPLRERRTHQMPIRVAAEATMLAQMLRQIWTHREGAGPAAGVLRKSLAVLFSHWGSTPTDPWHAGLRVGARLPLLALVAHFSSVAGDVVDPLTLLYEQRAHNPHLVTPPTRTFTLPPAVDEAFTAYEALLEEAIALGGRFTRAFHDGGHTLRLVHLGPAPTPTETPSVNGGLRFRCVANGTTIATFALPVVEGETIGALKERVAAQPSTPHAEFFGLHGGGRYLKLVESVQSLLGADGGASFDVVWSNCSHGAPAHPVTGASECFWDGSGGPVENPEY
jgi:hypothetical protein